MDFQLLSVVGIGILGGFIGAVAAGAGLITVPGLLLLGIPPQISIASSQFGSVGFKLGSLARFLKSNYIVWSLVLPMSVLGIIGSAIGARILIAANEAVLSKIIGVVLLLFLPALFFKSTFGVTAVVISKTRRWVAHGLFFLVKVWEGFFNPGAGFLGTYVSLYAYRQTFLESKGTAKIPDLVSSISAVAVFIWMGFIDYRIGLALGVGMFIGGYVGSHLAIKKGDAWLRPIMAAFILFVALKQIFF